MNLLLRVFKPHIPVPADLRENFLHLFGDIVWYGVLNGSTIAFLAVYATRLGATGDQVGLLGAVAAFANLVFTLPIGVLISKRSIASSVLWSAILNRAFYLLFVFIPIVLLPQVQIWVMIIATLVMSIPLTGIMVGFNALFAEAVPPDWRGYVASVRNALISISSMATTLLCGVILDALPQAAGYSIVFGIGFVGSVISTIHLAKIRTVAQDVEATVKKPAPGRMNWVEQFRLDILKTRFSRIVAIFFFFHLFQYLVIPVFPLYIVNHLKYSDQNISLGMSIFQVVVFLMSAQVVRFSRRYRNHLMVGTGMMLMAEFPAFLPFASDLGIFLLVVALSGVGWGIVSSTMFNYLLERMPDGERPAYFSWYNIALNAAILIGSMAGPIVAQTIGYDLALWIFAAGRLLIGVALLLWG